MWNWLTTHCFKALNCWGATRRCSHPFICSHFWVFYTGYWGRAWSLLCLWLWGLCLEVEMDSSAIKVQRGRGSLLRRGGNWLDPGEQVHRADMWPLFEHTETLQWCRLSPFVRLCPVSSKSQWKSFCSDTEGSRELMNQPKGAPGWNSD